jgi:enterochelin esterase family protein
MAKRHRGPIVEPAGADGEHGVTFVFQDPDGSAGSAGILCAALPGGFAPLRPLGGGVFAGTFRVPSDARVGYRFCPDPPPMTGPPAVRALRESPAASRADRLNPLLDVVSIPELRVRTFESILAMPEAPPAVPGRRPAGAAAGAVEEVAAPGGRPLTVYRPAGHDAVPGGLPLVLLLDGQHDWWRAPALFDALLAEGAVAPFVGALLGSRRFASRLRDLGGSPEFAGFVVDDLLPLLTSRYGVADGGHVVAGFSAGAVGAVHLALREPARCPGLIAISGAVAPDGDEPAGTPPPGRAYLAAGRYEPVAGGVERLGEVLRARGAEVRVDISACDHNTISARAHLAAGLTWMLPPETRG